MPVTGKQAIVILAFAAAVFFFVFAAFGWSLASLTYQDELAAGLTAAAAGLFVDALP